MSNDNDLTITVNGDVVGFSRAMSQVESRMKLAQGSAQSFGHAGVTNVQAISASLRLAEGGFNGLLRAAERFIAQSQGLSSVARAIFPLVGGVAVASIFVKMGKEAAEFIEQVNQIPDAVQKGYAAFNLSQRSTNDALEVTNARLDFAIAKLEGKPENGLALELAEARKQADDLASSLAKDAAQEQADLLGKNENGPGAQLMGEGTTKYVYGNINNFNRLIAQAARERDIALGNGDQDAADAALGRLHQYQDDALAYANQNIGGRQNLQKLFGPKTPLGFLSFIPGDQTANINALTGFRDNILLSQQAERDQRTNNVNQGVLSTAQNNKRRDTENAEVAREAAAEADRLTKEQQKALSDRLAFRDAMVRAYQSMTASDASELQKQVSLSDKWQEALSKSEDEALKKRQEFAAALEKHADQLAEIQSKNSSALQENNLNRQLQSGQISPYQAAVQTAQLHTNQYQSDYSRLLAEIQAAKNSGNTSDQDQLEDQLAELQGRRQIESANDRDRINANSFRAALDQFVNATQDAAGAMRSITINALNSVNSSLSQALMAHAYSGREYRRGIENAFGSSARGIGSQILNIGFQNAEGGLLKAFGFGGGGKPDGSSSKPFFVKSVDAISAAGSKSLSSIGGVFGSLFGHKSVSPFSSINGGADPLGLNAPDGGGFGFLQGFFANGGDVVANRPAIVGDGGRPEVFVPQTAGHIYPDASVFGGGSSTTNHVYIDASGSSDPGATEQAVHRAMSQYLPYSVGASVQAVQERQKRRPLSSR